MKGNRRVAFAVSGNKGLAAHAHPCSLYSVINVHMALALLEIAAVTCCPETRNLVACMDNVPDAMLA